MDFKERYKYNVATDLLGKGGFARVYRAYDELLEREVAVKVFNVTDDSKGSVLAEIRKAIKLQHPNLINYYDAAVLDHTNAFGEKEVLEIGVMEIANSGDLKSFMKKNRDPKVLLKLLIDVLKGLEYLHSKNIIHRDLKPQNILLHQEGDQLVAKISDFGISKALDHADANASAVMGTIEYMAPEQFNPQQYGINGRIDTNVDIWSFGVMIFELFTDRKLFGERGGDTSAEQIMSKILTPELPEEINQLEGPYRDIIGKCLVADASRRVRRSSELIDIMSAIDPGGTSPFATNAASGAAGNDGETMVIPAAGAARINSQAGFAGGDETQVISPAAKSPTKGNKNVASDETQVIIPAGKKNTPPPPPPMQKKPAAKPTDETPKKKSKAPLFAILGGVLIAGAAAYFVINKSSENTTTTESPAATAPTSEAVKQVMDVLKTDTSKAIAMLQERALQDNDEARYLLGDIYWRRNSVDKAITQFAAIKDKNTPGLNGKMGSLFYLGLIGGKPDYDKAKEYFLKAAEQDRDTAAYYYLGMMAYEGKGGNTDYKEAYKWSEKAANGGNVRGMANFATLCFNGGEGITKDLQKAYKWYEEAAKGGNGIANYMMGFFYEKGLEGIVQPDTKKALEYYTEAKKLKEQTADEAIKRLKK